MSALTTLGQETHAALPSRLAALPPRGWPGVRAPDGLCQLTVPWPPSKSNTYRIVTGRAGGRRLAKGEAVLAFEEATTYAVRAALAAMDYTVHWFLPAGTKTPRPINPLYGADCEVSVDIALNEPYRTVRDTDGILKALLDVLAREGVLVDDVQVGELRLRRPWSTATIDPHERVEVALRAMTPLASWSRNPGGRPLSTAAAARLLAAPPLVNHALSTTPVRRPVRRRRSAP